MTHRTP